jgi:hypothetical protein
MTEFTTRENRILNMHARSAGHAIASISHRPCHSLSHIIVHPSINLD